MVEFRADMYEKCFDREALMKTLAKIHDKLGQFPIIFTFRTKGEGGCMEATLSQYHDLLIDAIDSGYIDIVDIEYFSFQGRVCHSVQSRFQDYYTYGTDS